MASDIKDIVLLWIAPELNHYRVAGLGLISKDIKELIVLRGDTLKNEGHVSDRSNIYTFTCVLVNATYRNFNRKYQVYKKIAELLSKHKPTHVLMPIEKKFFPIILFILSLRTYYCFKMISYNHDLRNYNQSTLKNYTTRIFNQFLFKLYDAVIFYTRKGRDLSVSCNIIRRDKAFFANNTIDTQSIIQNFYKSKNFSQKNIVFIGRLVLKKRLEVLFKYFNKISDIVNGCKLQIIGDGPLLSIYKKSYESERIVFYGGTSDEKVISEIMNDSLININTGTTGLSILHCFAYGIPVIAFGNIQHPPEVDYIKSEYNGFLLDEKDFENNICLITNLLNDRIRYDILSTNALNTARNRGIDNWAQSIKDSLKDI